MTSRFAQPVSPFRVVVLLAALYLPSLGGPLAASAAGAQEPGEDEPPEAQALAERLMREPSTAKRTAAIQPARVVRLHMRMVRIVDRTAGVAGSRRQVEAKERDLEDRLRKLHAEVTQTEVIVRLPGAILFDFDSPTLRPDAEGTLEGLVGVIRGFPGRPVRVEGHTDSVASEGYNQGLSEQRAQSVETWLADHGIDAGHMQVLGYGESRPVADNATADGRQRNRRVEVIIEKEG